MNPQGEKTVLIVEDHSGVRGKMVEVLHRVGCAAIVASNGSQALKILAATTVDLIVTDIVMPEMDGFQMLRAIAKNPEWAKIPVVVLSGASDATAIGLAARLGARAFLSKSPFCGDAFLGQLRKHLSISGGRKTLQLKDGNKAA